MKSIKNMIIKLIGYNNYRTILVMIFRFTNRMHNKIWICTNNDNYLELFEKKKNIFFGYYDYSAERNDKILFLETDNDLKKNGKIYFYDLKNNEKIYITSTNTWNYQMGSRIRWYDDNRIIFNDYDKNIGFISRIVNLNGSEEKKFNFPIYELSRDNKKAFYTNFSILDYFRPGYGYINEKINKMNNEIMLKNGIFKGELENNKSNVILSMNEIIKYKPGEQLESKLHYINHIFSSPFDDKLMFFHLWINKNKELRNRVFIIDYSGKILNVIDDFERASHYTFKSSNEILLTVMEKGKNQYRLYDLNKNNYKTLGFLTVDGHPSYINDNEFITDTYPDHNGMQHIYLCNSNRIKSELVQIYHNPRKNDMYRCDLHPRYSNGILTFDSLSNKYRCENIIRIDLLQKKLNMYPKMSETKKIYMNLYNKIDVNIIKLAFNKIFDNKLKAHLLVNKMLNTHSKIKKTIYFNKLQSKYSMWISPECKIGENIHFMHLDGITIGSGTKIGNNCTIYQQVTVGKEKDKFPIIGDNVTIYAGAKIIGNVKIGDNAVVGANAVVIKDVPDNCVAVGVPARIVKKD